MGLSWLGFYPENFWACNLGLKLEAWTFPLGAWGSGSLSPGRSITIITLESTGRPGYFRAARVELRTRCAWRLFVIWLGPTNRSRCCTLPLILWYPRLELLSSLKLVTSQAWSLELGARTKAAGSWGLAQALVLRICNMFNFWIPAASTAAALVALLRCRTVSAVINDRGPMGPGCSRLRVIFCVA